MCRLVEVNTVSGKKCKIAEIKKDYVLNIVKSAQRCPAIDRIILFGSATAERCTDASDIDIAVFGSKTEYHFLASREYREFVTAIYQFGEFQDYDILYFKTGKKSSGKIFEEIYKGEVIYERNLTG